MPENLFKRPGTLVWAPDASANGAPPGVLLRADNLDFESPALISLRRGSASVYTGLSSSSGGTDVDALFTAYIDDTRYRMAGVGDKVYINGVDSGHTFDGTGDIAFCAWLGHIFMARGETRLKWDGDNVTNWGIPKPGKKLTAEAGSQIQEFFATCNSSESPAFTAEEGTITSTYPDGADGTANGSIEVTPAGTGRASIKMTYATARDYFNIDGYAGSSTDIIDVLAWFDSPQDVEAVTLQFGCSADEVSDPFRDDYFTFTFKIGGSATTAPQEEVIIKSSQAVAAQLNEAFGEVDAGTSTPPADVSINLPHDPVEFIPPQGDDVNIHDILDEIDEISPSSRGVIDFRPDASYNPGWTHLTVSRGALTRQGTTTERDWDTIRAVRIVYKAKAGSTGKARFDNFQIYGGGERALTGRFSFLYREVRAVAHPDENFEYPEKSPPSDPTPYVNFRTQRANLTVPSDALAAQDPQTNQLWIYMRGGYLDDWFRVAVTGASANDTSMAIDEFARSPDGNVSAFDRTRFNQFGLSIPGSSTPFVPTDISGLKLWLDADYIENVSEGSPVGYWPGRDSGYSTFTPTDVTSLKAWFKADSGVYSDAGVTLANSGDTVQRWADQTANGYHLNQATGANKPIYRTGIVNGKPVVRFDGLDDFLSGTTMSNIFAVGAKYALTVFKANTIVTGTSLWSDSGAITSHAFNSSTGLIASNDDGAADTAAAAMSAGTWYIGIYFHGTSAWTTVQSVGSSITSGSFFGGLTLTASGNSTGLAGTHIVGRGAATGYLDGDIAEMMFFNGLPTHGEKLKLERYLAAKYGVSYNFDSASTTIPARSEDSTLKPTYKANWRNSKPAVYFDGTEAMEICALGTEVATAAAKTVFMVGEVDALIGAPAGAGSVDNNSPFAVTVGGHTLLFYSGSLQATNDDGAADFTAARAYALDTPYIWTYLHDGATLYNGQNDTRTASMNSVASGNTASVAANLRLGAFTTATPNRYFKGYIAELIVYNEALTEANRQKVESYLASKYGLTDSIPYGLTASFTDTSGASEDLVITLSASELGARVGNERLPSGVFRPPEDIISMDAPYADRLWALTEQGYLHFSQRREPGMFIYSQAFKVADRANTPYWVKRTAQGVYVGTARDIVWIYGTGAEDPDTGIPDFTRINLNVADPPVSSAVTTDGNELYYIAARGPMKLSDNAVTPLDLAGTRQLWGGVNTNGLGPVTMSSRLAIAATRGNVYIMTYMPIDTPGTNRPVILKYTDYGGSVRWRFFQYSTTHRTIYREPDGTLLMGGRSGEVVQIETGSGDAGSTIGIKLVTPFEDGGFPLNRKDPFDFTLRGHADSSQALTVAFAIDDTDSTVLSLSATVDSNQSDTFVDDIDSVGVFRNMRLTMSGGFTAFSITEFNVAYRPRPQMRTHVDSGYLRKAGEELAWYRLARLCMSAGADVSVEFWFDDVLYNTKNVTVTVGKTTVYEIPLGREYKGRQPRVVVRKQDQASTVADEGFELYWLELRQRSSGNITGLDVKKVFTDLAVPLEQKEKK